MTPDRWRRIEDLYHAALERDPASRGEFLAQTCGDDAELRSEVERLLAEESSRPALIDSPVWQLDAAQTQTMAADFRLGPYLVKSKIGSGGMGAVFLAEDTRLERRVAIKVSNSQYIGRFQREAKAIAALNHPNICTIHDVGPNYMVMELLEGETLKQRIARGRLPLEDVLTIGDQITAALAEAHLRGIVHRDLKPGNIMLTHAGVKVLDFGLAKIVSDSATQLTKTAAVMGMLAYMAPEQVEGKAADSRSDLFSLGLLLYEMAAGQLPFPGASLGSMLISGDVAVPPPSKFNREIPRAFEALVEELLAPDPAVRPQSVGAVRSQLAKLRPAKRGMGFWAAAVGAPALLILGAAGWWSYRSFFAPHPLGAPTAILPLTSFLGNEIDPSFSPDGDQLAFAWTGQSDNYDIYTMPVGSQTPRRITTSPMDEEWPAWSPDGKQIAFLRRSLAPSWQVIVQPVDGGAERVLGSVILSIISGSSAYFRALAWTPDSKALVLVSRGAAGRNALSMLSLDDGSIRPMGVRSTGRVSLDNGLTGLDSPAISPSGQWLAYCDGAQPTVQKLGPGYQPIGDAIKFPIDAIDQTTPAWLGDRLVVSWNDNSVVSRILLWDLKSPVETLWAGKGLRRGFTISQQPGRIRMVTAQGETANAIFALPLDPATHAASGPPKARIQSSSFDCCPHVSPDGTKLTFTSARAGHINTWVADADGGNPRILLSSTEGRADLWFPDGKRLLITVFSPQSYVILDTDSGIAKPVISLSGSGIQTLSLDGNYWYSSNPLRRGPTAGGPVEEFGPGGGAYLTMTMDGKRLIYVKARDGLYARSVEGDPAKNPEVLLEKGLIGLSGISVSTTGIYYLEETPEGRNRAVRYFDFATRKSNDVVSPPPLDTQQPPYGELAIAPSQKELLFSAASGTTDLMMLEFAAK